jgi:hypothetical protein
MMGNNDAGGDDNDYNYDDDYVDYVRRGSKGCGVDQIVARRLAVRQARVRISALHPRGSPLPS